MSKIWELIVLNKKTEGRTIVGAGWTKPDGSISIQLNPCVALSDRDDVVIMLFPNNRKDPSPNKTSG